MRKMNNGRFRQNNSNSIYSLNYKFDSISSAGKFNGTALELIKKYNELAKEAHSNGDYVEMEVFRQYAEHYRKIVTEINERKNQNRENSVADNAADSAPSETCETGTADNGLVETQGIEPENNTVQAENETQSAPKATVRRRRNFTVVEVNTKDEKVTDAATTNEANAERPRRRTLKHRTEKIAEDSKDAVKEA